MRVSRESSPRPTISPKDYTYKSGFAKFDNSLFIKNAEKPSKFWVVLSLILTVFSLVYLFNENNEFSEYMGPLALIFFIITIILIIKYRKDAKFYENHKKVMIYIENIIPQTVNLNNVLQFLQIEITTDQKRKILKSLTQLPQYDVNFDTMTIVKRM